MPPPGPPPRMARSPHPRDRTVVCALRLDHRPLSLPSTPSRSETCRIDSLTGTSTITRSPAGESETAAARTRIWVPDRPALSPLPVASLPWLGNPWWPENPDSRSSRARAGRVTCFQAPATTCAATAPRRAPSGVVSAHAPSSSLRQWRFRHLALAPASAGRLRRPRAPAAVLKRPFLCLPLNRASSASARSRSLPLGISSICRTAKPESQQARLSAGMSR